MKIFDSNFISERGEVQLALREEQAGVGVNAGDFNSLTATVGDVTTAGAQRKRPQTRQH